MWLLAGPLEGQSVLLACKPSPALLFVVVVVCAVCECAGTHMHVEARGQFSAVCSFLLAWIPGIQLRLSGSYCKCCYLLTHLIGPQFLILAGLKVEALKVRLASTSWSSVSGVFLSLILLAAH